MLPGEFAKMFMNMRLKYLQLYGKDIASDPTALTAWAELIYDKAFNDGAEAQRRRDNNAKNDSSS